MNIKEFLLKKEFIKNALKEDVDLSCLKKRPSTRVIVGISIVLFSYMLGWPVIGMLSIISLYVGKPLIVVIGGPLVYGISHSVFLFGMYLAGRDYTAAILKWSTKKFFEKIFNIHQRSVGSLLDTEKQG